MSSTPIHWSPLVVGFVAGLLTRVLSIRSHRTRYPGFPSGYVSAFSLAIIASLIGSSVVVALMAKKLTAATFLTYAATQFRDVRETTRATLEQEEKLILVGRGPGYIEGIAITYEARNYLAMLAALATSFATAYLTLTGGILVGVASVIVGETLMAGPKIGDFVEVKPAPLRFEKGSLLFVGDIYIMEVGLPDSRDRYLKEGLGVVLTPKNGRGEAALWNIAQRQAIAHQAATAVGVQKDVGYPEQTPLCRMQMPEGSGLAALSILPVEPDMDRLIAAIRNTPVLESGKWTRMKNTQRRPSPAS